MAIHKAVITYSFLFDDSIYSEAEVQDMTIGTILNECCNGSMIGNFDSLDITELNSEQIKPELLEMGNDGTFFDNE